jgi:chemotaxis protein CheD
MQKSEQAGQDGRASHAARPGCETGSGPRVEARLESGAGHRPEPRLEPEAEVTVRIGEAKRAVSGVLKATLGSCVGIGLIWRSRRRCVLAHCLLPDVPQAGGPLSAFGADACAQANARYVENALPVLFRLLEIERSAYAELEAVLVGGASLAKLGRGAAGQIGQHNIEAARARLAAAGIRVVLERTGGVRGWQVMLDAGQLLYSAREIAVPQDRLIAPDEASYGHARTR